MPSSLLLLLLLSSSILTTATSSTLFNFTSFPPNTPGIIYSGDAFPSSENLIQLTRNQADRNLLQSSGRAIYNTPIQIRDLTTKKAVDFTTHFEFIIAALNDNSTGDGLAFFLAPVGSELPENSSGQWLGLFNSTNDNSTSNQIVAVEYDTYKNYFDPSNNHVGIDVNSIISVANVTWKTDLKQGKKASTWIWYNSTSKLLDVYLTFGSESPTGNPSLSYGLDLTEILPEKVIVGFSASTGSSTELHKILSWDFVVSTVDSKNNKKPIKQHSLLIGLSVSLGGLLSIVGFGFLFMKITRRKDNSDKVMEDSLEDNFKKGSGPKRFSYKELAYATKNFSEEGKLGQGGFGGVYKGVLNTQEMVAVKRISRGSSQGKKEYVSEVTVISQLRHRNLVQLIGWCHDKGEFFLVYELMLNGSLDSHLFGKKCSLDWSVRYKIAIGLASALLYLHEEWERCVVHRDIKSSNVMLDSSFNAKLGDFGLARLVDHDLGSQTTVLAGTMGYLAPECVITGRASKESDVFSFGVVALEIACGRKPVETKVEESKVRLVEWVWNLYGRDKLVEAVDERLNLEFNEREMECLMVVGLWCAHPDQQSRPSIRQAIQVLKFEAPLPKLPITMPVPMYFTPPLLQGSLMSNIDMTQCVKDQGPCLCYRCGSYTSTFSTSTGSSRASSGRSLLSTHKEGNPTQNLQNWEE